MDVFECLYSFIFYNSTGTYIHIQIEKALRLENIYFDTSFCLRGYGFQCINYNSLKDVHNSPSFNSPYFPLIYTVLVRI